MSPRPAAPPASDDPTAALFRALGDPTRLRMLHLTFGRPVTVTDLTAASGMAQPTVSHHVRVLAAAGLVSRTKLGAQVWIHATSTARRLVAAGHRATTSGGG